MNSAGYRLPLVPMAGPAPVIAQAPLRFGASVAHGRLCGCGGGATRRRCSAPRGIGAAHDGPADRRGRQDCTKQCADNRKTVSLTHQRPPRHQGLLFRFATSPFVVRAWGEVHNAIRQMGTDRVRYNTAYRVAAVAASDVTTSGTRQMCEPLHVFDRAGHRFVTRLVPEPAAPQFQSSTEQAPSAPQPRLLRNGPASPPEAGPFVFGSNRLPRSDSLIGSRSSRPFVVGSARGRWRSNLRKTSLPTAQDWIPRSGKLAACPFRHPWPATSFFIRFNFTLDD
jgi:hypothetical protein